MEYRTLEITVRSAKDLKNVNFFTKMDVYVIAMIAEDPRTSQKTIVDKDGGESPKWNHNMKFVINDIAAQQNRTTLVFRIKSDRALGDRVIGEVAVPVKELLIDAEATKSEKFVSYAVRTKSGKSKGSLAFSFKFSEKFDYSSAGNNSAVAGTNYGDKKYGEEPVMAYPSNAGPSYAYPGTAAPGYPGYPPSASGYAGHGYSHMNQGYGGYPQHSAQGYGYPGPQMQNPKKKNRMGMGMGLGAGLLGGLLIGDMVSDVGDMGGYDGGFDGGFDGGGFDF